MNDLSVFVRIEPSSKGDVIINEIFERKNDEERPEAEIHEGIQGAIS